MRFHNIFSAEKRVDELEKVMASIPLFAIRHTSTGRFLPPPKSGHKGGSWVEPCLPTDKQPRFFRRKQDAKAFLTVWSQGPQINGYSTDWETGEEEYAGAMPDPTMAAEPRIKSDYEIVQIFWGISNEN